MATAAEVRATIEREAIGRNARLNTQQIDVLVYRVMAGAETMSNTITALSDLGRAQNPIQTPAGRAAASARGEMAVDPVASAQPAPPTAAGGGNTGAPRPQPTARRNFGQEARLLFPWIPAALLDVFVEAWEEYGDPDLAMGALRQDGRYEQFFPGNRREDGSIIAPESEYLSVMEGYDRRLQSFGLDPGDFQAKKILAFQNGRSPSEVETDIGKVYVGIVTRGDAYRSYYATRYGTGDLSNTALLASALDTSISPIEYERRIRAAQVGGAAKSFGFDIARQEAERLESFGLSDEAARTLYSSAQAELPTLNALSARFDDPEDDLTAEEYANALVLKSPKELEAIGRLYARDRSMWSGGGLFSADRGGAQRGLLGR